jgi:hypothetical protein
MRSTRFLFVIAVGVVILVAALLISALLYFEPFQYQADDTPEGVVHNYLLALRRQDYKRAYGYLSPSLLGYPADLDKFVADVDRFKTNVNRPPYDMSWYQGDVALTVEPEWVTGDEAGVRVHAEKPRNTQLFGSGQDSYTFYVGLRRLNGAWKIEYAELYWDFCWLNPGVPDCH